MPRKFRTEAGPRPDFENLYGMVTTQSDHYVARTRLNILGANATLLCGTLTGGTYATLQILQVLHKDRIIIPFPDTNSTDPEYFLRWLYIVNPKTLNVAGNRESKNPGIQAWVRDFLIQTLGPSLRIQKPAIRVS